MKKETRLQLILNYLEKNKEANIARIVEFLNSFGKENITKISVNRDLAELLEQQLIIRLGKGPAVRYQLSLGHDLLREINIADYFRVEQTGRGAKKAFNFDVFDALAVVELFNTEELEKLDELDNKFKASIQSLPSEIKKKEYERLTIDFSWKSSAIEGNTYTLLETENLLKNHQEASGHTREEAQMILNHKEALNYLLQNKDKYKEVLVNKIEDVHYLLVQSLGVERNIRKRMVGISSTDYVPLGNEFQIREALEKMCRIVSEKKDVFSKSFLLNLLIAYIQPFGDGNKRTSRMMGNAVLIAHDSCPLSYRSISDSEYKKAVLLFYEQNNLRYFKELFMEQFEFAVNTYFL